MPNIAVLEADLRNPQHQEAIVYLVDAYARDPMGGGKALPEEVRTGLIPGLQRHPTTLVFLAWHNDVPVGIAICFVGFSTFLARPLINIHDLAVIPAYRGQGIGRLLLAQVAVRGQALGCCKLTLEVRADNHPAQQLYEAVGFHHAASYGGAVQVWFLEKQLASA
jgi:ribosomal protein S18 acetylase RimI-like enzyme